MSISEKELKNMKLSEYKIVDIRSELEVSCGEIPGSVRLRPEEIEASEEISEGMKLIICGSKTVSGEKTAEMLREKGFEAESLERGYVSWLLYSMQNDRAVKSEEARQSLKTRYRRSIWQKFTKALNVYEMIKPGDKIAVCISGGKDSMLLAQCFQELRLHDKFPFGVKYLVMDPGYSPENRRHIEENAETLGIPIDVFETDIFGSVYNVEKSPCYLCARMRRGYLYSFAQKLGCNKIALGHHYDDVIETILMGMLYGGQIQTMMPKLHSTSHEGMELIRPLYLVREKDIKLWRDYNGLQFIQCACKFTESCAVNTESLSKRLETKKLIQKIKKCNPRVESNIFKSVENVSIDAVISYKQGGVKHCFLDDYE